jgi:hypothetical protein
MYNCFDFRPVPFHGISNPKGISLRIAQTMLVAYHQEIQGAVEKIVQDV